MWFSDQPQKKKKKSFGEVDIKQEIKSEPEDHEAGKTDIHISRFLCVFY